jgi:DNA replication ATP-dependent helicase Dna2
MFAPEMGIDEQEGDKENVNNVFSACGSIASSQKSQSYALEGRASSPQLPPLLSQRQCPQTPVNRIPLADLIGNTEDAFNCDPKDTTPEDHIYWRHGPTPRSSIPSATGTSVSRRRKRARSSSPSSSSQQQQQQQQHQKQPCLEGDAKTPQDSLKVPHDPVLDLWARYTNAGSTKKDADGKPLPAFSHLIASSPETSNSKDAVLRRTMSCGTEWPTSKPKKRKTKHEATEGRMADRFSVSRPDIMAPGKSKASRISLLMERLQENSTKIVAPREAADPSSSSPLPARYGLSIAASQVSPVRSRPAAPRGEDEAPSEEAELEQTDDVRAALQESPRNDSSEFGDDDIPLEAFEAVEQSTFPQNGYAAARPELSVVGDQPGTRTYALSQANAVPTSLVEEPARPVSRPVSGTPPNTYNTTEHDNYDDDDHDDDEFGYDSDDDALMADLAAQVDTRLEKSPSRKEAPAQVQTRDEDDDDDAAYGIDDLDDDIWDQLRDGSFVIPQNEGASTAGQVRVIL